MNRNIMEILSEIQRELKAPKSQFNKFGNYNYRNCEDILEALKPLLKNDNASIIISDDIVLIGNRYYVKATASLRYGITEISATAYAREEEVQKGMSTAQITGSTSSYARKYALNGLFAIDDTKDADSSNKHEDIKSDPLNIPEEEIERTLDEEARKPLDNIATPLCEKCGKELTVKVYNYSMQKFGKAWCYDCQKG